MPPALGPGAPEGIDVVPPLARYLATIPRRQALLLRAALHLLERSPPGWRFSEGDDGARLRHLERMAASRRPWRAELVTLIRVLVTSGYASDARVSDAVGSSATCRVAHDVPPPAGEPPAGNGLGELEPQGEGEDCEYAVVGSGAGGAAVATVLAEAGFDVLVLEAGPHLDRRTYPREPLAALASLYRDGGLTIAEGLPAIPTPVGRAVGGTTVINSGTCFRAPGEVLRGWSTRAGIAWAPELEREFEQAEAMLEVEAVDPQTMGRNGQLLREGAERLGLSHGPLHRNAGRCEQCSSCPYGCRLDRKRAMHVSYLPRAVAAGARVRAGVQVERIAFEGRRARGLACVREAGGPEEPPTRFSVRASKGVIVCGGAFGTPELLLRSGVGSESGELGHNLRIHPACWLGARFEEEVRGWDGVMQSYLVDEWRARGLLLEATFTPLAFGGHWLPGFGSEHQRRLAEYAHIASTGVHLSDTSKGSVSLRRDGSLRVAYRLNRRDARAIWFGINRAAEIFVAAGAKEVYPQIAGVGAVAAGEVAALANRTPAAHRMRLEAFHPLGTARMDADPARGVVGTDGAVFGYDGLWVADASVFPSSIGVNPMLTIIALASRIASQIAAR